MTEQYCTINNDQDLWVESDARPFIGERCKVIKRTRAGLIQVALVSNPKEVYSFPQRNVDIEPE